MQKFSSFLLASAIMLLSFNACKAQSLGDILKGLGGNKSTSNNGGSTSGGNLTNTEITNGLKEALKIGANNASKQLSATDGFFKNAALKILLPKEAQQVESTLRSLGMGSLVDKAVLSMNRAAEDAAKQAAPIFVNAITSMSIQDGLNILTGGNNAATQYLQGRTTASLTTAFRPVIQKSLGKVGAEDLWRNVFNTYNQFSANKVNPDLTGYVTERAMFGIFQTIAQEEAKIRTNPAAQVTSLLKKVFGNR